MIATEPRATDGTMPSPVRVLDSEERLVPAHGNLREQLIHWLAAAAFLTAAVLLAILAPWQQPLSPTNVLLVLLVWITVEHVSFPAADGWTHPTMLVFVPALFLLPTPIVPLIALAAAALRSTLSVLRDGAEASIVPRIVGDAWYTIGPALVIVLTGAQQFAWSHWPAYMLALAAQVLLNVIVAYAGSGVVERATALSRLPLRSWSYVIDVALAPLGLLIAAAAVHRPGLLLIALSPTAMLMLFADERQQRLEQTLALGTAYRGTALLLADMVEADDEYTGLHSRDVVDLSLSVAEHLGLEGVRRRNVEFAALLHDIGKLRVPKEIINKGEELDAHEWEIIRRHTIEGERMLKQVGGTLSSIGCFVRSSHERYDGFGYPDGLQRRGDPARVAHHRRLRRLQRHDHRPRLPRREVDPRGAAGAAGLRRHPVRPQRRRRARDHHRRRDRGGPAAEDALDRTAQSAGSGVRLTEGSGLWFRAGGRELLSRDLLNPPPRPPRGES